MYYWQFGNVLPHLLSSSYGDAHVKQVMGDLGNSYLCRTFGIRRTPERAVDVLRSRVFHSSPSLSIIPASAHIRLGSDEPAYETCSARVDITLIIAQDSNAIQSTFNPLRMSE